MMDASVYIDTDTDTDPYIECVFMLEVNAVMSPNKVCPTGYMYGIHS
jgi:hypothetical protein